MKVSHPKVDFTHEMALSAQGYRHICGIDEVGRGPWAGPVVACAVILPLGMDITGLRDSKRLTTKQRSRVSQAVLCHAIAAGVAAASVREIETLNILQASLLAMARAVARLPIAPDYALVDGRNVPAGLPCSAQPLIRGDETIATIAAASVVAKDFRDRLMQRLDRRWPGYGWSTNAGYGVPAHRRALAQLGVTPHHRQTFRPIATALSTRCKHTSTRVRKNPYRAL